MSESMLSLQHCRGALIEMSGVKCKSVLFLQGAALGAMVGQMTYGKRQYEDLDGIMRRLILPFHQSMNELISMVDADSNAFNSYMVTCENEYWAKACLQNCHL